MSAPKPEGPGFPRAPPSQWAEIQPPPVAFGAGVGVGSGAMGAEKRLGVVRRGGGISVSLLELRLPFSGWRVYLSGCIRLTPESEQHEPRSVWNDCRHAPGR